MLQFLGRRRRSRVTRDTARHESLAEASDSQPRTRTGGTPADAEADVRRAVLEVLTHVRGMLAAYEASEAGLARSARLESGERGARVGRDGRGGWSNGRRRSGLIERGFSRTRTGNGVFVRTPYLPSRQVPVPLPAPFEESESDDEAVDGDELSALFPNGGDNEMLASVFALLSRQRPGPGQVYGDAQLAAAFPVFPSPVGPVAGSITCPICLERLGGQLLMLPCMCVGHEECMSRALGADVRCPLHRIDVRRHLPATIDDVDVEVNATLWGNTWRAATGSLD
jgi:hypothetical protein